MPGFDVILAFFGASFLLGLAPGPDNIFVLAQAALHGAMAGIMTTLGLMTGLCIQTLAVAAGVAVIFQTSALAFNLLKFAGCAYLLWLAWLEWRSGAAHASVRGKTAFCGYGALFRRGIIMNITNPKVCIFFLAFLPQFCDPAKGTMFGQIIFLGLLFILATAIVFFAASILGGKLAGWLKKSERAQVMIHKVAAMIFVGLALALILAEQ